MNFLQKAILKQRNRKLKRQQYQREFNQVLDECGDPGEAEAIMWCREFGFSDDGLGFRSKEPTLRRVV